MARIFPRHQRRLLRLPVTPAFAFVVANYTKSFVWLSIPRRALRALGAGLARTVDCGNPPAGTLRGVSRRSPERGLLRPLRGSACGLGQPDRFATGACRVLASLWLSHIQQQAALSLPCLGIYHWLRTIRLLRLRAKTTPLVRPSPPHPSA